MVRRDAPSTVCSEPGRRSDDLAESEEFAFPFDEAGEFACTCEIHPFMAATITVEQPPLGRFRLTPTG